MDTVFSVIAYLDNFYWSYIGWALITGSGIYLTIISRGLQFRALFNFRQNIANVYTEAGIIDNNGIHPFKLYFASVGGMVGLGNIVFICTAIMIGGPGSIFWTILASLSGMLLKYSEIYLGVKYRIQNPDGSFTGGPMYFLQKAFKPKIFAYIFAFLLCLYGVEISNFLIIVDRIEHSFQFNRYAIIFCFLVIVIYSSIGGIRRLANICSIIMPVFMTGYIIFSLYVIICNSEMLPSFFKTVLTSAFTGHAPIGGFVGSTMILSAYLGVSKSVYSGDIGIGYDSIMQSETKITTPHVQATLSIYAIFTDTLICVLTNVMVGVTGSWYRLNHFEPSDVVAQLLSNYIPYSDFFMTLLLFFAGYTTIIAYLAAGTKCAQFIYPKYGKILYLMYAIFAFIFFCNFSQTNVIIIMGLLSGLLVLLNVCGILKLRKDIHFI
ncbi:MAG: sodium:alanine symporter family protein [Rickettsiales bacterium]|nr:MAG: sodium:alanine symporter family protein [Rickettsiales bacterium]